MYLTRVRERFIGSDPRKLNRDGRRRFRDLTGGRRESGDEPTEQAAHRITDRHDVGQSCRRQPRVGHTEHHDRGDQQICQRTELALCRAQIVETRQLGDDPHDRGDAERHDQRHDRRARNAFEASVGEALTKEEVSDDRAREIAETIRQRQPTDHHVRIGEEHRTQIRRRDLDDGDAQRDPGRSPRILRGVEHAELDERDGVGDERECAPGEHGAKLRGDRGVELAEVEDRDTDCRTEERHERDRRNQSDHRQAGGEGEIVDDGVAVIGGGVARQARHDRGQDRHAEHTVRELQKLPVRRIHRDARRVGMRGDAVGDDESDLQDRYVADDRDRLATEGTQPRVDAPLQLQLHPRATQPRDQNARLQNDAERGADTQDQQLGLGHLDRIECDLAGHQCVQDERRDLDDVVQHRSPRTRFEQALHVQDGDEQRRQPVEQDLRQQQIGERCGQRPVDVAVADVEVGEQGSSDESDDRRSAEHAQRKGEDAVDEAPTTVGVLGFCADERRDHDRGQHGTEDNLGDHVRQHVRRLERGRDRGTEHGKHQHGSDEPGDAAGQRGERDRPGRLDDARVGVARKTGRRRVVGIRGVGVWGAGFRRIGLARLGRGGRRRSGPCRARRRSGLAQRTSRAGRLGGTRGLSAASRLVTARRSVSRWLVSRWLIGRWPPCTRRLLGTVGAGAFVLAVAVRRQITGRARIASRRTWGVRARRRDHTGSCSPRQRGTSTDRPVQRCWSDTGVAHTGVAGARCICTRPALRRRISRRYATRRGTALLF